MKVPYAYKPVQFFLIAILLTWAAWLTAAYLSYQPGGGASGLIPALEIVGLFGPFLASLWMVFAAADKGLRRDYINRLLNLKLIKPSSFPVILLVMPAAVVVAVWLSHLFFGRSLDQLSLAKASTFTAGILPVPVMLFVPALLEELGWKGYGVDSLRGQRTFFTATLIYAALWACWHSPLFLINGYYHNLILRANPLFALNFFVSVFPMTFIINWLWHKNKGSVLTAVLVHASANCQGLLPLGQLAKGIETAVMVVMAIIIVGLDRKTFFAKFPARIGDFG
ncbi:MAG: CPBP family intramembrane glutamic endopeptidase [Candidatus Margulisiibacteriota bacterium]